MKLCMYYQKVVGTVPTTLKSGGDATLPSVTPMLIAHFPASKTISNPCASWLGRSLPGRGGDVSNHDIVQTNN